MLTVGIRKKRVTQLEAFSFCKMLETLPIRVYSSLSQSTPRQLIELANNHTLTAYDAAYLDIALRLNAQLATFDTRLCDASNAAHITLWQPI